MGAGCSGSAPVVPEGDQQPLPKRERRSRLRPSTDWTLSTGHEDLIDQIEAASKKSKSKEHEQDAASAQTRPHARVVLLGAGSVGKSTLVRLLNQDRPGYDGERSTVAAQSADAAAIRAHLFYVLRELLRVMRNLGVAFADEELGKTAWDLTKLQMLDSHSDVHSYGRDLSLVLADPAVTKVLSNSDEAPLSTHTGWFLSQHERILSPAYVPAPQDLLRLRVRTTGVARHTLRRLGHTVEFVDVGGMRAERRKWAEIRLESDLVVFVASLADFGRSLAEDDETNRLAESLTLYKETLAALSEQRTAHCLVLTHDDELRRLLEADAAKVTAALETAVGARIDAAAHEGGSIEALHVAAVGAVRSKFAECGSAAMTLVVDSTDVATSRPLIDAALLLGVARHLRSKQSRGPPSALHDFEDARDILSHFPPPPTPVGLRRAMVGEPRATSPPATI